MKIIKEERFKEEKSLTLSTKKSDEKSVNQLELVLGNMKIDFGKKEDDGNITFVCKGISADDIQKIKDANWRDNISIKESVWKEDDYATWKDFLKAMGKDLPNTGSVSFNAKGKYDLNGLMDRCQFVFDSDKFTALGRDSSVRITTGKASVKVTPKDIAILVDKKIIAFLRLD